MSSRYFLFFFFKQKTAYEMRISDWSSDVCSSDLGNPLGNCGRGRTHSEDRPKDWSDAGRPTECEGQSEDVGADGPASRNVRVEADFAVQPRSEERRVGKECVSKCRSRWSPYTYKNKVENKINQ